MSKTWTLMKATRQKLEADMAKNGKDHSTDKFTNEDVL